VGSTIEGIFKKHNLRPHNAIDDAMALALTVTELL